MYLFVTFIRNNDSRAPVCEGRGECDCGRCVCAKRENMNEIYSGQFCECDNFNCARHNKRICAGHGDCVCQQCKCHPGWTGRACECPISQESCRASNGKLCNNRGKCICGVCKCSTDPEGIRYSGPTCEICPTCPTKCVEYKPCVMCQQFKTGPYNVSTCAQCPFTVIPVDKLPELEKNRTAVSCQFVDQADDCTFYFKYELNEDSDNVTVWVQKKKDCPPPVPVLAIVLGVIAGIVLIGLVLLLIWKLLTIIHDRREYARFEKERLMAKWDTGENPIFHPATTTFKNPAYGSKM
ncbi:unnamed protein product [Soboliphyme baturini]|uniref:Integrin_B_tail domain-containing protein n=1 Tax=Soboliphyme baturini TaxID=241478 RepID=A0A183I9K6_9BILA|nr:unnamed protein product [Soboliphyme baturini]